jgi:tetratricopeptide (TPR) repeat protein
MKHYSKVRDSGSSIDQLVELIKEDIDSIMKRVSCWSRSEALLTELCTQTTSTSISASINDALEDDISTWRIVILYLNRRRPLYLADKKIRIDEFYDIDKCINSIKDNTSTTVFLIISMNTFSDIRSVFELDAVHAVYIVTDLESNEQIQTMSKYSKLSGIFALDKDLLAQLTADICFHRQIRVHVPIISVFEIESNILEKLTEHQIDFLFFQLFSSILSQLPTQSASGAGSDTTSIDWQLSRLIEANMTVSKLLKQFNTSTLQESVSKLNEINKHIMSLAQNVDLSSATVYRVQIVLQNDLNIIKSNLNALLAIHSFVLASHSFKSVAKICRRAVDNQLIVVLFELKLLDKASAAHLDSYTVVFSLGTLFRLVSIDLAPDGVWRAQLEVANGSMQRIKDQLQIEIGFQLTWFTFGNYLTTFKRFDAAKKYYEYLLLVLPLNHPSLTSIYNNIGLMYLEMNDDKEALKWFDQAPKFNIKELSMQIEEKNLPIMNLPPPQFSSIDRISILSKMAETNYHQGELKDSLDCYRQALQIADDASLRQFFQAKIAALLSYTPDSET